MYGTSFNLYQRDSSFEAVLVEGTIGATIPPFDEIRITPGTRLSYEAGDRHPSTEKVDTSLYLAWTKGVFYYNDMPVKRLLADLAAWYDIAFDYPPELGEEKISLKLDKRTQDISEVLSFIEIILNKQIVPTQTGRRYRIIEKELP